MPSGKFHILLDGGHGSSGKGAVTARIADILNIPNVSGCNFSNAGHFVQFGQELDPDYARILFKALPSAAALWHRSSKSANKPTCWVGPNAGFSVKQVLEELDLLGSLMTDDLHIHGRAAIVEQHHIDMESPTGSLSTEHISSTMSGAGAAYSMKAMRQLTTKYAMEIAELNGCTMSATGFYEAVQRNLHNGEHFLHEVAQGFPLSIDYGNHPRHCTFRNATAMQAAADMGIRPNQVGNVYLNLRTYPIRVGNNYRDGQMVGYSGDWEPDQIELDWRTIGEMAGMPEEEIQLLHSNELTSVTKKLRRVASFSFQGTKYAARFNGARALILNFTSYIDWNSRDAKTIETIGPKVERFYKEIEDQIGLPVVMLGTGAEHSSYVLPYGANGLAMPASL